MSERLQPLPRISFWKRHQPLLIGLAVGLIAGPLMANALHLQVTSSDMASAVEEAIVREQSKFCEMRMRQESSQDMAKLNYVERSKIAVQYATFAWDDRYQARVVNHCASELGETKSGAS